MQLSPDSQRFWVVPEDIAFGRKGLPEPAFNVDQTARFFFNQSGSWLRLRMKPDENHPHTWLMLDGEPIEIARKDPGDDFSARVFSLADIEPMAWSLHGFEIEEIEAEEKAMAGRHRREIADLEAAQEQERGSRKSARQLEQMAERHPKQRYAMADRHAADRQKLVLRRQRADRRLAATVALVKAEAVLYDILPAEDL